MNLSKMSFFLGILFFISGCGQAEQATQDLPAREPTPTVGVTVFIEVSDLPTPQISLQAEKQALPTVTPAFIPTAPSLGSTPTPTSSVITTDRAILISETIPDGTVMQKGDTFIKTWTLKNVGTETWEESYYLDLLLSESNDPLEAPLKVNFGKAVKPGESIDLSLNLIAPQTDGSYTVTYRVVDKLGNDVLVGNSNKLWLTIMIGKPSTIQYPNALNPAGISFSLGKINHYGEVTSIQVTTSFSMRDYSIQPVPTLIVDGKQVPFAGGVDDWQESGVNSYLWKYVISKDGFDSANSITLIFDTSVRKNLWGSQIAEACLSALSQLQQAHPGISFGCNPSVGGYPYDSLIVPAGLTRSQTHQLVMDAIESAVYGRWEVKIR